MKDIGTYTFYKASYALAHASSIFAMMIIGAMILTPVAIVLLRERSEPLFSDFFGTGYEDYEKQKKQEKEEEKEEKIPLSKFFPTYEVNRNITHKRKESLKKKDQIKETDKTYNLTTGYFSEYTYTTNYKKKD